MERLAAEARALEAQRRFLEARDRWQQILPLLPYESKQAEWIRNHAHELEATAATQHRPGAPGSASTMAKRLAPLGPLAVILAKFKTVLVVLPQLKFLLSFASFIAIYWSMFGPRFGVGFAVLILIHEMGHYIDIKRRGLPADMPVFFPGLGAYVRWQALGVSLETRAAISLAGPLAGSLAAAVCVLIWFQTRDPLWAALARAGAWLNALNLIPVWIFDGASAARALNKMECALLMLASAGLGYALNEKIFYFVAVGCLWPVLKTVMVRQPQQMAAYGVGQIRVSGNVAMNADDGGLRQEGHGIFFYFLGVLVGLALVLWLTPGHGTSGLP